MRGSLANDFGSTFVHYIILKNYTLKEHLDKIKKPYKDVRLDFTGGEYEIRTRHLLPARQAL